MFSLEMFGFRALWSPNFFLFLLALLFLFFFVTHLKRNKFADSEPLKRSEAVLFTLTIVLLYLTKGGPLDLMGHLMFYAHMIQMAVLYLVIPPLLVISIPTWLWRKILNHKVVKPLFHFFTKPLIALIIFNGMFSFYHIPLIFDTIKLSMWMHASYTAILFVFAIAMWWPLMNRIPEYQSLSGLKKVGYVFADGILLTPACALIIFADTPMYATYSDPSVWMEALKLCVPAATLTTLNLSGPEVFSSMSIIDDQQLGGVIMKIIQEIVYGVVLAQIFFSWYRKEQSESEVDQNHLMNPRYVE
ncbi:cytochrome c oxidase assembly factor CtaG [Bacillus sp. CGMCC 1.16607]|uniref:cytochrome c oxidase assembly factor CtaG n=1 Tax=Bacillus sp. CGMCC 1.16607 TaxID=3351842 RepID=UPI00363D4B07